MPYITQEARKQVKASGALTAGELSFVLCEEIRKFLIGKVVHQHAINFAVLSEVLAALDATTTAFKEDVYLPYERNKKTENGGVF